MLSISLNSICFTQTADKSWELIVLVTGSQYVYSFELKQPSLERIDQKLLLPWNYSKQKNQMILKLNLIGTTVFQKMIDCAGDCDIK